MDMDSLLLAYCFCKICVSGTTHVSLEKRIFLYEKPYRHSSGQTPSPLW